MYKTLVDETVLDVVFKKNVDMVNPTIFLMGDYLNFNYCKITEFNRFYFIDSVEQLNSHIIRLSCRCDVLSTYTQEILGSSARFKRGIRTGDYLNVPMESSFKSGVNIYESDKELDGVNTMILTSVRG